MGTKKDVYNNSAGETVTGISTCHEAILSIGSASVATKGAFVQGVSIQSMQPSTTIREVGSKTYYTTRGKPQGSMTISRFVAEKSRIKDIFGPLLDPDNGGTVSFTLTGQGSSSGINYLVTNAVVTQLGLHTTADSEFVQNDIQIQFGALMSI